MEKPVGFTKRPRSIWNLDLFLGLGNVLLFLAALAMVFLYAPREATMGDIQRIFYFHVASAWVGFAGFLLTAISGLLYLIRKNKFFDILSLSSAEMGLVFISMTLLTGMLWAKPVWGVFWTWEPRLTISAIQWLIYAAYLILRSSVTSTERGAKFAAVYAVAAAVTVPLSWFAIRLWRAAHPQVFSAGSIGITPKMLTTLLVALIAFSLVFFTLLRQRMKLEQEKLFYEQLKQKEEGEGIYE